MKEINENSTYDEAFKVSIKMIKKVWKTFPLKDSFEYGDLLSECALLFYGTLKNKYAPCDACNICSTAYPWVAHNMMRKHKDINHIRGTDAEKIMTHTSDKTCNVEQDTFNKMWLESNPLELKDIDWKICQLLMDGYDQLEEIGAMVHLSPNTVQQHMKDIRKNAAKYYGVNNYEKIRRPYSLKETSKKYGKDNPNSRPVECWKDGKHLKTYESVRMAANELGLTPSGTSICAAIRKGYKSGGYTWKYAEAN